MPKPDISADELVGELLAHSEGEVVCILDSCGMENLGSHLLIAGSQPRELVEITDGDVTETLAVLDAKLTGDYPCIFTLSYDFGRKMLGIPSQKRSIEPDVFLAAFDDLVTYDYATCKSADKTARTPAPPSGTVIRSNASRDRYFGLFESIRERIRSGDTYQTNLTHQLSGDLATGSDPKQIFQRLRKGHPAPFAAYISRPDSTVVSASPERFFLVDSRRNIRTSPIKGTRPRGRTPVEDQAFKDDLLASQKDIAENTMIVDLLRNDLGRVCEYGSVTVEKLCELEEHPSFFDLVSTISGQLRNDAKPSDILKAMFPCGSVTGAPKISTMKIIDELETEPRGLSMGAIGCYVPNGFNIPPRLDLSVAIRTMVIRDGQAMFNVGGGITIDSDAESEWDETMTKAKALLGAIGGEFLE